MSEYQFVAFRAIDRPVTAKNLEYMQKQSSRAEISPWSFENEYHFGDFGGNAVEMLRRGYDIHVHYADFGIRKLMLRFPQGLPNPDALKPYAVKDSLYFQKDKEGPGGCLFIDPYFESGEVDELGNVEELLDRLAPLRAEILEGDLRPLYVAHLAVACDSNHDPEETTEAPVPAGLGKLSDAQDALAEYLGLGEDLLAAAARESPALAKRTDAADLYAQWLRSQDPAVKDGWLESLLKEPTSPVRAEMLAKYRAAQKSPAWATAQPKRTIAKLRTAAVEIAHETQQREAATAARKRAKRLDQMATDPDATLREAEKLAATRTTEAYRQIGELLVDLREALKGSKQAGLAEKHAQKLKAAHPTLNKLTSELRRRGFVPK